jgi:pimeloyl-ACP methyl ester carboxylesterase
MQPCRDRLEPDCEGRGKISSQSMRLPAALGPASAVYLQNGADPVFGLYRPADTGFQRDLAILICPPFGWDDLCSHRSRHEWAADLAADGYASLHIDLPGCGDSGGSCWDRGRLQAWTDAVKSAAAWLGLTTGCARIAAIGIGLGGLVLCRASAENAPIDELILWAVPARGRTFCRELQTFSNLEDSRLPSQAGDAPLPEGSILAAGFVLSPETVESLRELDVTALAFPANRVRRVLLLGRDGLPMDASLQPHFEQAGAAVTIAPGKGFSGMMAEPHKARPPVAVFSQVRSWLAQSPATERPDERDRPASAAAGGDALHSVELVVGEERIRETPLTIEQPFGHLFGVLAQPTSAAASDLAVVLLNAGAIRRIGPGRLWVELARRWASWGVPTLRLDLEGIGDADGDAGRFAELAELYVPGMVDQVVSALDALEAEGVARRFVLVGLCSGAYWSFHGALRDERVVAAFMLNPKILVWDPSLETMRDLRGLLHGSPWRKLLQGKIATARIRSFVRSTPHAIASRARNAIVRTRASAAPDDELDCALDRLRERETHLLVLLSIDEPLREEFERNGRLSHAERWPNLEFDLTPLPSHTLRPIQSQRHVHETLDLALERELPGRAPGRQEDR